MPFLCPYCKARFAETVKQACPACGRTVLMPRFFRVRAGRTARPGPDMAAPAASRHRRRGPSFPLGVASLKVAAILALLAVAGAAMVARTRPPPPVPEARKLDRARLSLANLRVALEMYRDDCGAYPSTQDGLAALIHPPDPDSGWKGPYISMLKQDLWGTPFQYRLDASTNLVLFGCGPDRLPETEDDLVVAGSRIALELDEGRVHGIVQFRDGNRKIIRHQFPTPRAIRATPILDPLPTTNPPPAAP